MEPDPDEQQYPGEEGLSWTDGIKNSSKPKGLYSKTSEVARGFVSSKTQCALFCGGKKCKYCSDKYWSAEEMVINGLYSQWVTSNILAMARPSNVAIKKYDIIKQFQEKSIKTVINLQLPYEHADCGPHELDQSGFLYDPQTFMGNGIFYYNFGWSDYGVASLSTILDIVKVMQFAVIQGKVAIHCHAGRGRTGVIIACYLVFTNRISGREAIHYVRAKRPNSVQTRPQMQVIEEFEMYLRPFRMVFASRLKDSHEFSMHQFLNRQQHILHGYEARRLKHIPKILYTVCERLLDLAKKGSCLQKQFEKVQLQLEQDIVFPMMQCSTVQAISLVTQSKHNGSHNATGKRRYKQSIARLKNRTKSISLEDLPNAKFKAVLDDPEGNCMESLNNVTSNTTLAGSYFDDDDNSIVFGNSWTDIKSLTNSSRHKVVDRMFDQVSGSSESLGGWSTHSSIMTTDMSENCVQLVAQALLASVVQDYVEERAKSLEDQLNTSDSAWINLCMEGDPYVLSLLLWDWLDQLKEPVLRPQDLSLMLDWVQEPQTGLLTIEKGTRYTLEYLIKVLSKLKPLKKLTVVSLYEKLFSHLTHQWVVLNNADGELSWAESSKSANNVLTYKDHWGVMKSEMAKKLLTFIENLQHEIQSAHLTSAANKICL